MVRWLHSVIIATALATVGQACKESHTDSTSAPEAATADQQTVMVSKVVAKLDKKDELKQQYDALPEPQKQFVTNLAKQIVGSWQGSQKLNFSDSATPAASCSKTSTPLPANVTPAADTKVSLTQDAAAPVAADCPAGGGNGGGGGGGANNCPRVCVSCYASAFATAYASVYATAEAVACSSAACALFAPNGNAAACFAQFCAFARSEAFAFGFGYAFSESWATACSK